MNKPKSFYFSLKVKQNKLNEMYLLNFLKPSHKTVRYNKNKHECASYPAVLSFSTWGSYIGSGSNERAYIF